MGLFRKKKETEGCNCCSSGCGVAGKVKQNQEEVSGFSIKVLGSGCAKCNDLELAAKEALLELGINTPIDHVTDFKEIASYGVMSTPALVVNERVISYGKVLKSEEIVKLLKDVKM